MINLLIVHGPNLNLLGEREPEIYGHLTLAEIDKHIKALAGELKIRVEIFQSNHEGDLIDFLHRNRDHGDGLVINAGAFTHYSYALRDAISAIRLPAVEVHLSDISKREPFRRVSVIRDVCIEQISGKGLDSYLEGIRLLASKLTSSHPDP
jgi:3-dehydroquinate dehydratase-2